jgi:hypothetical protein
MTVIRVIAFCAGLALLLALSVLGVWSAVGSLDSMSTTGQRVATVTQLGYALTGVVAAGALLAGVQWATAVLWLWAVFVIVTGGLAPMVWGGAGPSAGLAAAATSAAIAGLVAWLATRRRAAPSADAADRL